MTDHESLYAAVLDRPEDDTPRLVLADYLDDHGEPERAAFIRVQVELARTPGPPAVNTLVTAVGLLAPGLVEPFRTPDPHREKRRELRRRERELLDAHGVEWLRGVPNGDCLVETGRV